jgi:hypothetical protein
MYEMLVLIRDFDIRSFIEFFVAIITCCINFSKVDTFNQVGDKCMENLSLFSWDKLWEQEYSLCEEKIS